MIEKFERPAYRVLDNAGFFGDDDTLYSEGAEIIWEGEPSLEMEPLNETARIRYLIMVEKLDSEGRKAAEKLGRPYTGFARNLEGGLQVASAIQRQDMSLMGSKEKSSSIETVEHKEIGTFGSQPRRGRGRPRKDSISSVA